MTGSGCFAKGCLFGCAAPLVIVVLTFAVGGTLMGPVVERYRGENAWLDYLARAADFARGASENDAAEPPEEGEADSAAGRPARRPGVTDPAALPADLPVHPRPIDEMYSIGPDHVLAFQRVRGSRKEVIAHFRQAMRRHGWEVKSEAPDQPSTVIIWRKPARHVSVEFVDRGEITEVWLRSLPTRAKAATAPP